MSQESETMQSKISFVDKKGYIDALITKAEELEVKYSPHFNHGRVAFPIKGTTLRPWITVIKENHFNYYNFNLKVQIPVIKQTYPKKKGKIELVVITLFSNYGMSLRKSIELMVETQEKLQKETSYFSKLIKDKLLDNYLIQECQNCCEYNAHTKCDTCYSAYCIFCLKKYIKSDRNDGFEDVKRICACRKTFTVNYRWDNDNSDPEYGSESELEEEEEEEEEEEVEEEEVVDLDEEEEEDDEEEEPRCSIVMPTNVVNQEDRISFAMSFILERASRFNRIGNCGNFKISQNEYKLTYSEIKNELVPVLQAEGFDVALFYTEDNQYDEQHFDNMVCVEWNEYNGTTSTYMRDKIERFPKTTDEYHQFEDEEEREVDDDHDENEGEELLLSMANVPQQNRITHAMSFILNKASRDHNDWCCGSHIKFEGECKLTYSEIKNELVPVLQGEGFDVELFFTDDNQFDEEHFDNRLIVWWTNDRYFISTSNKIERFPKTTEIYYYRFE